IQKTFENVLAAELWHLDTEALVSTLAGMLEIPTIVGVTIVSTDGENIAAGGIVDRAGESGDVGLQVNLLGLKSDAVTIPHEKKYKFSLFQHSFPIFYTYESETKRLGEVTLFSNTTVIFQRVKLQFFLLVFNAVIKTVALWFIFLWFSNRLIRKPLTELATATQKISLDNLSSAKVDIGSSARDELKVVEESFNQMIDTLCLALVEREKNEEEKLQLEEQLRQAYKMEAMGTLAGGIAHDFNNILFAIIGFSNLAIDQIPKDNPAREMLEKVLQGGYRARDLVKQILAFSRKSKQDRVPMQISVMIKEALKLLRATLPTTIEIQRKIDTDCGVILADPTQIHQIIMNLCTNAKHAMDEKNGWS
nr:HAMP domain-containing protein [Desulfobulbaceae bacterium]